MAQISIVMAVDGTRWSAPRLISMFISGLGMMDPFRVISRTALLLSIQATGYDLGFNEYLYVITKSLFQGTPVANFPSNNCNIASEFAPNNIIINLTFCELI